MKLHFNDKITQHRAMSISMEQLSSVLDLNKLFRLWYFNGTVHERSAGAQTKAEIAQAIQIDTELLHRVYGSYRSMGL